MEGRRAHAVAHLAYARSQKSGTGILGSKRVLQGGEKSSPLSVLRDLWLVYGVYGLDGEKWKHGPGSKTAGLGQTLVAGSVVQGEKPRVWVKPGPAAVWSRERNRGFGSSLGGGKCGPGSKTAGLGQALVAGNVVQGEKPRVWVKPSPARVWSRERNCAPGSSAGGGKCGPGRETAALGQALPRRSMVQGEKPRVLGQAQLRPSVVQGEKPRPRVKPGPAAVWSRERNRAPGSNLTSPEHGPGRETAAPGQARLRRSVAQGEKPRPRVKPGPAAVWSREQNCAPGQPRPSRSMVLAPEIQKGVKTNI